MDPQSLAAVARGDGDDGHGEALGRPETRNAECMRTLDERQSIGR
jgi:hypothetical protein